MTTSEDSKQETSHSLPSPMEFEQKNLMYCDVEYAIKGNDLVYHFWPVSDADDFPEEFSASLELAFASVLPPYADVRASFTSKEEASIISRFGDTDALPVPTYYVRVVGWADNPMADKFLKHQVFVELDEIISKRFAAEDGD